MNWYESVTVTYIQNHAFIFFVYILIHISANMSPFGFNFHRWFLIQKQVNWCTFRPFSFVVLHKLTLLPSTFKDEYKLHS